MVISRVIEILNDFDFACQRCSKCCRHTPGTVYLTENDVELLITHLNIPFERFKQECCNVLIQNGKDLLVLKEKRNYDCIFWSDGCIVYDSRPAQCRSFPFWPEIVEMPDVRKEEMKRCPGIGKKGDITNEDKLKYYLDRLNSVYFEVK